MGDLNKIKDESVRRLAETLRSSGLAASDGEAIRMAENMSRTGGKVSQNFEEKKEKSIMGLAYLNKQKPEQQKPSAPAQSAPVQARVESVVPQKEDCGCGSGCECNRGECDCSSSDIPQSEVINQVDDSSFSEEPEIAQMTVNEAAEFDAQDAESSESGDFQNAGYEEPEVPSPPFYSAPESLSVQDGPFDAPAPIMEREFVEELYEPEERAQPVQQEPVAEEKKEEKPIPKKDLSGYKEAKVDLGAVFKYKG